MLSREQMLSATAAAREFSASFNSALMGTVGVYYALAEAITRGRLSAREKFRKGCAERFDGVTPVNHIYPELAVSRAKTLFIVESMYPEEMSLLDTIESSDVNIVRYALERAWMRSERKGFWNIMVEIMQFEEAHQKISKACGKPSLVCNLKTFLDDYFEEMLYCEYQYLFELKDIGVQKTHLELPSKKRLKMGISI